MTRRLTDTHLPPCVYLKHGAYWLVKQRTWYRLTNKESEIPAALRAIRLDRCLGGMRDIDAFVTGLVAKTSKAARYRRGGQGLEHTLTTEDAMEMLKLHNWRCAVTGMKFSLQKVGSSTQRPYAPSIDRIDSSKGYTKENCRIVCVAANFAMGAWGDAVLHEMVQSMRQKLKTLDVSKTTSKRPRQTSMKSTA